MGTLPFRITLIAKSFYRAGISGVKVAQFRKKTAPGLHGRGKYGIIGRNLKGVFRR